MTVTRVVALEAREVDWSYAPGQSVRGSAYNGEVPGPLIEAKAGDTIQVRLTNNLPQSGCLPGTPFELSPRT
jgi:FtsP/CotA-like multicopper oxidase with cupredoxin domain